MRGRGRDDDVMIEEGGAWYDGDDVEGGGRGRDVMVNY